MTSSNKIITNDNINLKTKKSISKNFINLDFPDIKVAQCEYSEGVSTSRWFLYKTLY